MDIDVGLATNGVLLTKERITKLGKVWDTQKTVHVSVDAATQERFFQITGSRDFSKVLECTKTLLEYGLDVIWNFVYTPKNKENLAPVCELACELGVSKMFVLPVIKVGRAIKEQFSFKELQTFLVHFPEIEREYPSIRFRLTPATPLDFLVPLLEAGWDFQKISECYPYARTPLQDEKYREIRNIGCIGGVGRWAVNAQGDVFPCELFVTDTRMRCGNLLEDSFLECLDSCGSIVDVRLEEIGNCASCKYADVCGGGCRARAFVRYGDLFASDPLCPFGAAREFAASKKEARNIRGYDWKAFTVKIDNAPLRVRKESFGGTVYLPGREQQIYVNRDGYVIFEILVMFNKALCKSCLRRVFRMCVLMNC